MRNTAHHFAPSLTRDDPVAAAQEEIRQYLVRHHIVPSQPSRRTGGHPILCFLGLYAILALIVALGSLWLNRVECDPVVMDRGLTSACRDWSRDLGRITGSDNSSRLPAPDAL